MFNERLAVQVDSFRIADQPLTILVRAHLGGLRVIRPDNVKPTYRDYLGDEEQPAVGQYFMIADGELLSTKGFIIGCSV